jgi:hypothetical protein
MVSPLCANCILWMDLSGAWRRDAHSVLRLCAIVRNCVPRGNEQGSGWKMLEEVGRDWSIILRMMFSGPDGQDKS